MTKRSDRGKQEDSSAQASQQEHPDWVAYKLISREGFSYTWRERDSSMQRDIFFTASPLKLRGQMDELYIYFPRGQLNETFLALDVVKFQSNYLFYI